jgi:hypothetical protein
MSNSKLRPEAKKKMNKSSFKENSSVITTIEG